MERKLQAICSGTKEVGAGVGDAIDELLAADCGRMTSTTSTMTKQTRPHAKIHQYKERWYHFTGWVSTAYKPLSAAMLDASSSCLFSSFVTSLVESKALNDRLVAVLPVDGIGSAPGVTF
jgi:hypothetical protein